MDTVRGLDNERIDGPDSLVTAEGYGSHVDTGSIEASGMARDATDAAVNDVMFDLGGDERRMHVRAYNHWVSLLKGRPYPSITHLEPATITDFGPHSVLLDFSSGMSDPRIAYLGRALREECGLEGPIASIADVPSRSLLSRLTDHYLQIIANRAPIGFEAEFVSSRGCTTLYRGILMPFASGSDTIDFIYGVINWKELADADLQSRLAAELDASVRGGPPASPDSTPVWADGPSGGFGMEHADDLVAADTTVSELVLNDPLPSAADVTGPLGEQLAMARKSAAQVRAAEARSQAALYRTLGRAYDMVVSAEHDSEDYAALLSAANTSVGTTPIGHIVALVFGVGFDGTRRTHLTNVLSHASRHQVPIGGFANFLSGFGGDLAAVDAAERAAAGP